MSRIPGSKSKITYTRGDQSDAGTSTGGAGASRIGIPQPSSSRSGLQPPAPRGIPRPPSGLRPPQGPTPTIIPGARGIPKPSTSERRIPQPGGISPGIIQPRTIARPQAKTGGAGTRVTSATVKTTDSGGHQTLSTVPTSVVALPSTPAAGPSGVKSGLRAPQTGKGAQPAVKALQPPSALRQTISREVIKQSKIAAPGSKIQAQGVRMVQVAKPPRILTPDGTQEVTQKIIMEKRVEKTHHGEHSARSIIAIDIDEASGRAIAVEREVQEMDPNYTLAPGPFKEIISVASTICVTPTHMQTTRRVVQETLKLDADLGMDPHQVSQLVEEEKEDVQNTLRITPPDLLNTERIGLKKRLQKLRLNSENVALLEQSVIHPPVTGDEAQVETTPEVLATLMHTSEKGLTPEAPPVQVFNTLFTAIDEDPVMTISSVAPGPLVDVVVPQDMPAIVHEEILSSAMEEASIIVQTTPEKPSDSIYVDSHLSEPKLKIRSKRPYKELIEEEPPWTGEDMLPIIEAVGAQPFDNLSIANIMDMTNSGNLSTELQDNGIEYILDGDSVQYYSRVQLRGSQQPMWFPGYLYALPEISDLVKVAKSPSQVLLSAWKATQPDVFPEDSIVYN